VLVLRVGIAARARPLFMRPAWLGAHAKAKTRRRRIPQQCLSPVRGQEVGDTTDKEGPPISVRGSGAGRQPEGERGQHGAHGAYWAMGCAGPREGSNGEAQLGRVNERKEMGRARERRSWAERRRGGARLTGPEEDFPFLFCFQNQIQLRTKCKFK